MKNTLYVVLEYIYYSCLRKFKIKQAKQLASIYNLINSRDITWLLELDQISAMKLHKL